MITSKQVEDISKENFQRDAARERRSKARFSDIERKTTQIIEESHPFFFSHEESPYIKRASALRTIITWAVQEPKSLAARMLWDTQVLREVTNYIGLPELVVPDTSEPFPETQPKQGQKNRKKKDAL